MDAATYLWRQVPYESNSIKRLDSDPNKSRVMLIGVPNKDGDPPRSDYFAGIPNPAMHTMGGPTNKQCVTRGSQTTCEFMDNPPFPIGKKSVEFERSSTDAACLVSLPIEMNLFSTSVWNVQSLLNQTVISVCAILPTASPTPGPTMNPTTKAPTKRPTLGPTQRPTSLPSRSTTRAPTRRPTRQPSFSPST
jgi:hypothetical protein